MNRIIPLLIGISALSLTASASTVSWGVDNDFNMVLHDAQGALLRIGSYLRIGTFSLSDIQIQALAEPTPSNIASLDAAFTPFGSTVARIGGDFTDGGGVSAVSSQTLGSSNALIGAQIYIWAFKSTNDTSAALSLSTAFQQAIFYRNKAVDADWQFPGDLSPAPTIDAGDLRTAGGALASGGVILAGSFVPNSVAGAAYNTQATSAIQLVAAVPEPTSVFLIAAGAAGLMMRRRRQS